MFVYKLPIVDNGANQDFKSLNEELLRNSCDADVSYNIARTANWLVHFVPLKHDVCLFRANFCIEIFNRICEILRLQYD